MSGTKPAIPIAAFVERLSLLNELRTRSYIASEVRRCLSNGTEKLQLLRKDARALCLCCVFVSGHECVYVGVKFINKSRGVKVKCVASNITKHKWIPHNINERSQSNAIK